MSEANGAIVKIV